MTWPCSHDDAMRRAVQAAGGIHRVRNLAIPTRDGTNLAADLYLSPDPAGPLPVVLEYSPYRKDEIPAEGRFFEYLARHGYVVARVDIRGTGSSGGVTTDEYVLQEQLDGFDTVEFLAAAPFCDGQVNMMDPPRPFVRDRGNLAEPTVIDSRAGERGAPAARAIYRRPVRASL